MRRINRHERIAFIDARTRDSYMGSEEVISHAMRVPPDEIAACAGRIPRNPLVVYCDSPHEQTSMEVARELRGRGFLVLGVLSGGLDEWRKKRGFMHAKLSGEDLRTERAAKAPAAKPPSRNLPDFIPGEGVTAGTEPVTPIARTISSHHRPSHA